MNRHVRLVLIMAVATTAMIAIAAIAWRVYLIGGQGLVMRPRPLAPVILLAVPVVLLGILVAAGRHLASYKPGISEGNPRHVQAALLFQFLFVTGCQAWMAYLYVERPAVGGDTPIRLAVLLLGVAMAVRGNFVPKLGPPPPSLRLIESRWTRTALRTGRALGLIGACLAVSALFVPAALLWLVLVPVAVALIGLWLWQRRMLLRPKPGSDAPPLR